MKNKIIISTTSFILIVLLLFFSLTHKPTEDKDIVINENKIQETLVEEKSKDKVIDKKEDIKENKEEIKEEVAVETSKETSTKPNDVKKSTTKKPSKTPVKKETSKKKEVNKGSSKKDKYQTEPTPSGKPKPVEPEDSLKEDKIYTANLSVNVNTLLNNMEKLDSKKHSLVPKDGFILKGKTVKFTEGENVFEVLEREMRREKIHMDFNFFPAYNSVYIKGINNIYEFDAGPLSGWLYKVNGWFPNYGASRYELKQGDVIEIVYSLEMGKDVGGDSVVQQ